MHVELAPRRHQSWSDGTAKRRGMIHSIPHEVSGLVFDLLDTEALLNACLVNHAFSDIASRSLYKTLIVNKRSIYYPWGRDAFMIFHRRPELRFVVRNVVLHPSSGSSYYTRPLPVDARCYSQLAKLKNVKKITLCPVFRRVEINSFWAAAGKLPLLETVVMRETIRLMFTGIKTEINIIPPNLHNLTQSYTFDLNLAWDAWHCWAESPLAYRIRRLEVTWIDNIESLPNLEDIEIAGFPSYPISFCSRLGLARNLTRIAIHIRGYDPSELVADLNATDTGLTNLISLKINLHTYYDKMEIMLLYRLVRSLASHSRLHELAIISPNSQPPYMSRKSDRLLTHILSHHALTLRKLKLPFYSATRSMLLQIFDRCTMLKKLCISLKPETSVCLPIAVTRSSTLETIHLVGRGRWIYSCAGSLLSQYNTGYSSTSLIRVKLSADPEGRIKQKLVWKAFWEYDTMLDRPIRRIRGPEVAQ